MRRSLNILISLCAFTVFGRSQGDSLEVRRKYCELAAQMHSVYSSCVVRVESPAEDVSVPIEMYDDGLVKSFIHATQAQYFINDGLIWAKGVSLRQLDRKGQTEAEIHADQCVVDRKAKCGWAEGHATADYGPHHLEGEDVYFSLEDRYFRISDRTVLTSKGFHIGSAALSGSKVEPDATNGTSAVLTSRRSDYDNRAGVILFDGDVVVDDGEYRLGADRLWVYCSGTNAISRFEANGSVAVTNGARSANCARVEYDTTTKKLVMHSDGRSAAELVERGEHSGTLRGERIVFWLDSEQVEVEKPVMTIETNGSEEWKRTLSQRP